jgi:hypothetical protein
MILLIMQYKFSIVQSFSFFFLLFFSALDGLAAADFLSKGAKKKERKWNAQWGRQNWPVPGPVEGYRTDGSRPSGYCGAVMRSKEAMAEKFVSHLGFGVSVANFGRAVA